MLALDQAQVDSLALFAEACAELDREPFFIIQSPLPTFSSSIDWKHVTFKLGDRFEFRTGLVPFWRIWLHTQPGHWETVVNILLKANLPPKLALAAKFEGESIRREIAKVIIPERVPIPNGRAIELWLNAGVRSVTLASRKEWEIAVAQYGHASLDFVFRSSVKWIGYHFRRLADQAVRPTLELAESDLQLKPSFQVSAITSIRRKEQLSDGAVILREGNSDHGHEETFEERYHRLLQGYDNQSLARILGRLEASPGELMRAVLWCGSIVELLDSVDGRLEITSLPREQAGKNRPEESRGSAVSSDGIWFYAYEGNLIVTSEKVVPLLDAAIARLRQQLLAKQ